STFNSAMFFTFIGGAPHVVVAIMHRSPAEYGIWFVILSLVYMVGNFAAGRWSARYGVDVMIKAGVAVTVIGAAVGVVWMLLDPYGGPAVVFAPQMIIGFASGFMLPNAIAGAVSVRPQAAGTAAGITGFMQMGLGAATSQLIGHLLAGAATGLPLALIVLVLCACGLAVCVGLVRRCLFFPHQLEPLVFGQHRDASLARLVELGACTRPRHHIIGFLRHRAGGLGAEPLGHRLRFLARHLFQGAGEHHGLARDHGVACGLLGLLDAHLFGETLDDLAIVLLLEIRSERVDHRLADLVERIHLGARLLVALGNRERGSVKRLPGAVTA